ncbi:MAG: CRISPR-associated protein Csx3, partial [Pirellulaceae bacterium]
VIVRDAIETIESLNLTGGAIIKFNGPASLPVAMALAHSVAHRYEVVACFDPKLNAYIVAISHHPTVRPGDRLPNRS